MNPVQRPPPTHKSDIFLEKPSKIYTWLDTACKYPSPFLQKPILDHLSTFHSVHGALVKHNVNQTTTAPVSSLIGNDMMRISL